MKNILLITEPRTGSSSLMKSIASAYGFDYQFEPDKKDKLKSVSFNINNLYTAGNQYMLPNGRFYKCYYHYDTFSTTWIWF